MSLGFSSSAQPSPGILERFAALALRVSDGRGHHGDRRDRDTDRGPCPGPDPNGGRAQNGHDPHPNTLQNTDHRHDEVQPSARPRTEAVSSIPRAICSAFLQDTNSPRSRRNPGPGSAEELEPHGEPEAARY
jgi:hypothetical protein